MYREFSLKFKIFTALRTNFGSKQTGQKAGYKRVLGNTIYKADHGVCLVKLTYWDVFSLLSWPQTYKFLYGQLVNPGNLIS